MGDSVELLCRLLNVLIAPHFLLGVAQVYNGLTLLLLSFHPRFGTHRFAGPAIACGGLVFSGSIWALVLGRDRQVDCWYRTVMGG
jgi:uncharacterized membrane protein YgdD (TMEM256/DUF423 family)